MFSTKLLFTVLVVLYYCTTVSTDQYYVVAENTTDCLPADGECHALSFYVAHSSSYFTNNIIFYFKEGTHTVMDGINITGVQNVSFIGLNQHVMIHVTTLVHYIISFTINSFSLLFLLLQVLVWQRSSKQKMKTNS